MPKLNDLQFKHTQRIGQLIDFAYKNGYRLTQGCAYCEKRGHHKDGSCHYIRLANDFNLFIKNIKGEWTYTHRTDDHEPLGEFWEMLGGAWGGRFGDGNHYSTEFEGRK